MRRRFEQPKNWQWGRMLNVDGVALRTGSLAPSGAAKAHIVFGPGLNEFSEKYFEMARILTRLGYHFHTLDWRGQGGSPRYLSEQFKRHAGPLASDVRDLVQFAREGVPDTAPKFYIGNSLGGLIGFLALAQEPDLFQGSVLNAPPFGVGDRRLAGFEAVLARLPLSQHLREHYVPGALPGWRERSDPASPLKPQDYSSDPVRMGLNDEWMRIKPDIRYGAITIGFTQELCRAIGAARGRGVPESITTPTMIFSAGQDKIVRSSEIFNIAARIPGAFHTHIAAARHESFLEADAIRRPIMRNIHNFIRSNLPKTP